MVVRNSDTPTLIINCLEIIEPTDFIRYMLYGPWVSKPCSIIFSNKIKLHTVGLAGNWRIWIRRVIGWCTSCDVCIATFAFLVMMFMMPWSFVCMNHAFQRSMSRTIRSIRTIFPKVASVATLVASSMLLVPRMTINSLLLIDWWRWLRMRCSGLCEVSLVIRAINKYILLTKLPLKFYQPHLKWKEGLLCERYTVPCK